MPSLSTSAAAFALLSSAALILPALATSKADYIANTLNATDVLNSIFYNKTSGMWQNLWWNSGAILSTIGDVALLSDDFKPTASNIYSNTLDAAKANNPSGPGSYLNDFYDDESWWAMGFIKAYHVTGDSKYLDAAKEIFEDLLTGNNATCGGHLWNKQKTDNTAIGNELYLAVAASLANRDSNDTDYYRQYAQAQVDWFFNSALFNENNTINDNLNVTNNCERQGPVYTYNQGVILGALVEMNTLTGNTSYIDIACTIAHAAIEQLATPNDGILTEVGYPGDEDTTGAQFKGVFARNLMYLQAVRSEATFVQFLQMNADSIWSTNRQDDGQLGALWQGPIKSISASSHSSALDCLVAAAVVS